VGRRIREARKAMGWTQAQLGEHLGAYLGKPWSVQSVSQAEAGRRDFTAEELVALAAALERPVGWLFLPHDDAPLDFAGGIQAPAVLLKAAGHMGGEALLDLQEMREVAQRLEEIISVLEQQQVSLAVKADEVLVEPPEPPVVDVGDLHIQGKPGQSVEELKRVMAELMPREREAEKAKTRREKK
jgi:transcriptional regulator with XRE-family HTH domain